MRRNVIRVSGEIELADGTVRPVDESALRHAPERALRLLSLALPLLAGALVALRLQ